jgi:hypothetical protein
MEYGARIFNKESYDENDSYAKNKFKNFLVKNDYTILNDVENYNHDLIAEKNGKTYYFEVEVKKNYPFTNRESFKFQTVSFLGRKKRLHEMQNFVYIIICKETEWAISCISPLIYEEQYTEEILIDTIHRNGYDKFYRVPKEKCHFFNLN